MRRDEKLSIGYEMSVVADVMSLRPLRLCDLCAFNNVA